jgi:hypothetical protein
MFLRCLLAVLLLVSSWTFAPAAESDSEEVRKWRDMVLRPLEEVTPTKPLGLKYQVEDLKKRNQLLRDEVAALKKELADVKEERMAEAATPAGEAELRVRMEAIVRRHESLVQELDVAAAEYDKVKKELDSIRDTTEREVRLAREQERERAGKQLGHLQDQLKSAATVKTQLQSRLDTMSQQLAKALQQLRDAGIEPAAGGRRVIGSVLAVKGEFIQISAGSSGGVKKGDLFDVYHPDGDPVGRAEVTFVAGDKSAARLSPDSKKDSPRVGDLVREPSPAR